jgi:hypothetical protein
MSLSSSSDESGNEQAGNHLNNSKIKNFERETEYKKKERNTLKDFTSHPSRAHLIEVRCWGHSADDQDQQPQQEINRNENQIRIAEHFHCQCN